MDSEILPPLETLITPEDVSRFHTDLASLDRMISEKRELSGGLQLARHRAEVVNGVLTSFFHRFVDAIKPRTRLSFGVCGGSGRLRSTGNSDTDTYLFIKNDHDEENLRIWRSYASYIHYVPDHLPGLNLSEGVSVLTYDSVQDLETQTFSSLLDMYPLYDNSGFEADIRECLRNVVDPLLFKLEKIAERKSNRYKYPQSPDNLELFNIKEAGLREIEFYKALKAIDHFQHTSEIGMPLELEEALDVLFTARLWINHKKPTIRRIIHEHDVFSFSDFHDFVEHFGEAAFEKLYNARLTATKYADEIQENSLEKGIKVSENVVYGNRGLRPNLNSTDDDINILMDLVSQSQQYGLPITKGKKLKHLLNKIGDLPNNDKFAKLLFENEGRLHDSFKFLYEIDQLHNVIPGYCKLKYKLPSRKHVMHTTLQGAIRRRLRNLDNLSHSDADDVDDFFTFLSARYNELRSNKRNLVSLRLALISKDILDINLDTAYPTIEKEVIANTRSILSNQRFFRDVAYDDMISEKYALESFLYRLLKSNNKKPITLTEEVSSTFRKELLDPRYQEYVKGLLGMLLLYTYAYMDHPHVTEINRTEKMKAIELYKSAIAFIDQKPCYDDYDPWRLSPMGRSLESTLINEFPSFFNNNVRVRRLDEYANELVNVMYSGKPIIRVYANPDRTASISIFSPNYKGLFRLITGVLYEDSARGLSLRSAQVYSPKVAMPAEYHELGDNHSFAMDFLTIDIPKGGFDMGKLRAKLLKTLSLDRKLVVSPPELHHTISPENIIITRSEKVNKYRLSLVGDLDFKNLFFPISDKLSSLDADISAVKGHPDEEGGYRQNYFFRFDGINSTESDRRLLQAFHVDVICE